MLCLCAYLEFRFVFHHSFVSFSTMLVSNFILVLDSVAWPLVRISEAAMLLESWFLYYVLAYCRQQ